MVNPYTIIPGQDYSQGLAGLAQSLDRLGEQKAQKRAEEKYETMKAGAIEAYNTKDPEVIAAFMLDNPEMAKAMEMSYKFYDEETKKSYLDGIYRILSDPSKENVMEVVNDRKIMLAGKEVPEEQIQETMSFARKFMGNPKEALKQLEFDAASLDSKRYKAWKEIYRPGTKGTSSNLKKMIDERQALLDKGLPEDDPRVKAYDAKINPEEAGGKETTPTNLKKLWTERADLLAGGTDPKSDIIKGYDQRILGAAAPKKFSPSSLKKLITERQTLIDGGADPESPTVRAYDNAIAGIDLDVKDLTPEQYRFHGIMTYITGKMPSVGRGKMATKVRMGILKATSDYALETAKDDMRAQGVEIGEDMAPMAAFEAIGTQSDTRSIQGALNALEKQTASMGSFIENMDNQMGRMRELAKDIELFDTRLLNVPYRLIAQKGFGNPNLNKWDTYIKEISRETTKLALAATQSIAPPSEGEIKTWDRIHDQNLSVGDILQVLEESRHAANIRYQSVINQRDRTRGLMRDRTEYEKGIKSSGPTQISTQEEYNALPSGTLYIGPDGKSARKK